MPRLASVDFTQRFQRGSISCCPDMYLPLNRKSSSTKALVRIGAYALIVFQRRYIFQSSRGTALSWSLTCLKKSGLPTLRDVNLGEPLSAKYSVRSKFGAAPAI